MDLQRLNFPEYKLTIKADGSGRGGHRIFDKIRLKYVALTPEEWVRQHLLMFLTEHCRVPKGLIGVEKEIRINRMPKRFDALVYDRAQRPLILVECKAPSVEIGQDVFDQAARYNLLLKVPFFLISNGMDTLFCRINHDSGIYEFLGEIPFYDQLILDV